MNKLYVVGPRQSVSTGHWRTNIQGFDYEDTATGLKLNVRKDDVNLRINGELVSLVDLNDWLSTL